MSKRRPLSVPELAERYAQRMAKEWNKTSNDPITLPHAVAVGYIAGYMEALKLAEHMEAVHQALLKPGLPNTFIGLPPVKP